MSSAKASPTTHDLKIQPSSKLARYIRVAVIICTPIILSFLVILPYFYHPSKITAGGYAYQLKWIYIVLVVGVYFTGNVLNFSVTSTIPFISLPILGVAKATTLAAYFMSNVSMAHLGALIVVLAIQSSGLTRRLALLILRLSSGKFNKMYTLVFLTALLFSMFINSGGGTFLLVKIVDEILEHMRVEVASGTLGDERMAFVHDLVVVAEDIQEQIAQVAETPKEDNLGDQENIKSPPPEKTTEGIKSPPPEKVPSKEPPLPSTAAPAAMTPSEEVAVDQEQFQDFVQRFEEENEAYLYRFGGELLFGVAVAANIGGTFLPTSSAVGDDLFLNKYVLDLNNTYSWSEITWVTHSFPLLIVNAAISLAFLLFLNFARGGPARLLRRVLNIQEKRLCVIPQSPLVLMQLRKLFSEKYTRVCPRIPSFPELITLFFLFAFIVLNIFRWPVFMPGWVQQIRQNPGLSGTNNTPHAGDSAIFIMIVLLIFTTPYAGYKIFMGPGGFADKPSSQTLLGWKTVQNGFPWSILILIAAARALGACSENTIAAPLAAIILGITKGHSVATRALMILFAVFLNIFLPSPGTTLVVQHVWMKAVNNAQMNRNDAPLLLTVLSVVSLTFAIPASSVPTALVYRSDKSPSAIYFLKVGIVLFFLTVSITTGYALIWRPGGLTYV